MSNVEKVKELLLEFYQADYYPNIRDDYATRICQLFESKPDESRMLTKEEINKVYDELKPEWTVGMERIALCSAQDAKTASIVRKEMELKFNNDSNK
jgi:hypothetical protein